MRCNQELLLNVSTIGPENVLLLLRIRHLFIFEGFQDLFASEGRHDHSERGSVFVVDLALLRQIGKESLELWLGVLIDPRAPRLLKWQYRGLLNFELPTLFGNLGLALIWSQLESDMVLPVRGDELLLVRSFDG